MNQTIEVGFNPRTKRLMFKVPFNLNDAIRDFPSRRFDPKTKQWAVPLVKANLMHFKRLLTRYSVTLDEAATAAVKDADALMQGPVSVPFPRHVYDFTQSKSQFTPMAHQDKMLDHAWNLPAAAWFARMGTGKTFAAIHLACARWKSGLIDALVIVCPSTLARTWQKEFAKYATCEYDFRIHSTNAGWLDSFYQEKNTKALQVMAVSVEGLGISEGLYDSVCGFYPGRRVFTIVDESSRIKNPKALRANRTVNLGAASTHKLILNGTPIALGLHDLFMQYEFLDPNITGCGDYWAFRSQYLVMGGFEQKQIVGYKNVDQLMNNITPYTIEVDKSVLNLPPKIMKERYITATSEQKALFRQILKGEGDAPFIKCENVLERMLRLRQVVGGWRPESYQDKDGIWQTRLHPLEKNPKFRDLVEFIDDHFVTNKFIIWSTFRHEIQAIEKYLAEKYGPESVASYYGDTDKEERSRIEERYCTDSRLRFFVGHPASAGLGLTLVSEFDDTLYYYSGTSAFIDRTQSEDRAHRIGQEGSVLIVDAIMEKTIDEVIQESKLAKQDIETFVFERIRAGVSEIEIFGGGDD